MRACKGAEMRPPRAMNRALEFALTGTTGGTAKEPAKVDIIADFLAYCWKQPHGSCFLVDHA